MESLVDVKITGQFIKYILSENFANNYNGKELLNVTYWCTAISYREVHCTPC